MKYFSCTGYWTDDGTGGESPSSHFNNMIVCDGEWNGIEDASDERIFFYTDGLPVVGNHGEFVITTAYEIWQRTTEEA